MASSNRFSFGPLLCSIRLEEVTEPVGLRLTWPAGTEEGVELVADTLTLGVGIVGVQELGSGVDPFGLFLYT